MKKKNKDEELTLPGFKSYYKTPVNKTIVLTRWTNTSTQQNCSKPDLCIYERLRFWQRCKAIQWRGIFVTNGMKKLGIYTSHYPQKATQYKCST